MEKTQKKHRSIALDWGSIQCRHFFASIVSPMFSSGFHAAHSIRPHLNLLQLSFGYFNWSVLCVFIRNITVPDLTLNCISKCNARVMFLLLQSNPEMIFLQIRFNNYFIVVSKNQTFQVPPFKAGLTVL